MQKFDHNIGFEKNANFFAKNGQKTQKILIITSTPVKVLSVNFGQNGFVKSTPGLCPKWHLVQKEQCLLVLVMSKVIGRDLERAKRSWSKGQNFRT
jgi:hypothetical protein